MCYCGIAESRRVSLNLASCYQESLLFIIVVSTLPHLVLLWIFILKIFFISSLLFEDFFHFPPNTHRLYIRVARIFMRAYTCVRVPPITRRSSPLTARAQSSSLRSPYNTCPLHSFTPPLRNSALLALHFVSTPPDLSANNVLLKSSHKVRIKFAEGFSSYEFTESSDCNAGFRNNSMI